MATQITRRGFLRGSTPDIVFKPIRPPGASSSAFEDLCINCTACHDSCPETIIAVDSAGRPWLDFTIGACTFCGSCSEVCPTGALRPENVEDWAWQAVFNDTCMSVNGIACRICQDACEPRAISFRLQTGGCAVPVLDAASCTGCGACASVCPTQSVHYERPSDDHRDAVA
ncbi:MAG: ferredoxin-type protein NapF [Pseudomonadota bacterium]